MWVQIAIWIATTIISYALRPKPENARPRALDRSNATKAEEGLEIPVLFGCRDVFGNALWYGHFRSQAIKSDSGKKG